MNESVLQKLSQFAPTPPSGVWNRIADTLDAEPQFSQRLHDYEEPPPAAVWDRVQQGLDAAPAKTVTLFRTHKSPLRYVAAASLIAAVLAAATLLLPSLKQSSPTADGTAKQPQSLQNKKTEQSLASEPQPTPENTQTVTYTPDRPSSSAGSRRTLASVRPQTFLRTLSLTGAFIPRKPSVQPLVSSRGTDDLMVYTDGDGMAMKLSKKLFSLVNCRDGDGSCKERIRQLQQKMVANTAGSDFTGMLDLVRQLQ